MEAGTASSLTETETRRILIDPLIEALGYDLRELDQVRLGWRGGKETPDQQEADYALFIAGQDTPSVIVEAKRFRNPLSKDKHISQALTYAFLNRVPWCILTNGNRIKVFDAFSRKGKDRLLFEPFDIEVLDTDSGISSEQAAWLLGLLSPDSVKSGKIEEYKKTRDACNAVFQDLKDLVNTQDTSLVRLLRKRLKKEYTPKQIINALTRIRVLSDVGIEVQDMIIGIDRGKTRAKRKTAKKGKRKRVPRSELHAHFTKLNTIVCPAKEEGFHETFLGQKQWYAIRIRKARIPYIKYIAIYRTRPISAITHYAEVASIKLCNKPGYKGQGKYIVKIKGEPLEIEPVNIGKVQSPRYMSLDEILR